MFERSVKQSLSQSPEAARCQTTRGYSVLFTCTHQRSPPIALLRSYRLDLANFASPLSFSASVQGDTLQIHGKALQFLKLESSRQPMVEIW